MATRIQKLIETIQAKDSAEKSYTIYKYQSFTTEEALDGSINTSASPEFFQCNGFRVIQDSYCTFKLDGSEDTLYKITK